MKKRFISAVLALALLTGAAGCSSGGGASGSSGAAPSGTSSSQASGTGEGNTQEDAKGAIVDGIYRYHEPVHVKATVFFRPEYQEDPGEKWIFKWAEDKMNIVFETTGMPESSLWEQTSLLFASGELPDVLLTFPSLATKLNQIKYGDEEGQLVAIDEYMTAENMPNLTAILEEIPLLSKIINTPEGHFYAMPEVLEDASLYPTTVSQPFYYNNQWFSAIGYEKMPDDVDGMLEALRKLKAQDPGGVGADMVPWGGSSSCGDVLLPFFNAFGFYGQTSSLITFLDGDYLHGGKIVATGLTDNYYAYLQYVHTLYAEELIDQDFYTLDYAQATARCFDGKYGIFPSFVMNSMVPDLMAWTGLEPLTSEYSSVKQVPCYMYGSYASLMSICTGASDEVIDACLRFADVHYDPDYKYTTVYGPVEGEELYGVLSGPSLEWKTLENGAVAPNVVGKYGEDCQFENWVDLLEAVSLCSWSGSPPDRRAPDAKWHEYDSNDVTQRAAAEYQRVNGPYAVARYDGGVFTGATAERVADLQSPLQEYFNTETAKFITGVRELNDSEWALFQQELKDRGYEEYLQLQQQSYQELYGD